MAAATADISAGLPKPEPLSALLAFLRAPFVGTMFLSLLFIGADRLGLGLGGLNLRITFPLLMLSFGLLYIQRQGSIAIPKLLSVLFFLLAIAGAISTINSFAVTKSVGYTIWIFFNFFIIIVLGYNLSRQFPPAKVLSLWFLVFRIHVFLVVLDTALNFVKGDYERSFLWFYEPSYMAIFLTAYFGSALFMFLRAGKPYALDFVLASFVMLLTATATAMFGLVFALLLNLIVARQRLKLFLWSAFLGAALIGILYAFFSETLYYKLIAGFIMQGGSVMDLILTRAGNRWIRVLVGWDAFLHHPWTGVGIGGDTAYMNASPLPEASYVYVKPWLDLSGQPFCNIFVEVLGTMGIAGFIPFVSILGYCGWKAIKLIRDESPYAPIAMAFMMGFFCSILAMQLEGTMLRYYLWSPLGLAFGVMAHMRQAASASSRERALGAQPVPHTS